MDLSPQKDFYDNRRYFQGKDNPGDQHPEVVRGKRPPRGQVLFGIIFFGFVAALFWLRVRSEDAPSPKSILARPATVEKSASVEKR
jgi:hypothetical protein